MDRGVVAGILRSVAGPSRKLSRSSQPVDAGCRRDDPLEFDDAGQHSVIRDVTSTPGVDGLLLRLRFAMGRHGGPRGQRDGPLAARSCLMALDQDAADAWRNLARSEGGASPCAGVAERMREQRLTFGGRLLCPFLRPFFLTRDDERRVVAAAETIWGLGERVATAAMERADLLRSWA